MEGGPRAEEKRLPGWLWALCLAQVASLQVYASYAVALPLLKSEWSLTNAQAGGIYTAYYVGYILATMVLATASDYLGSRRVWLASVLWSGGANLLFPLFAQGFWSGLICRALTGMGLAGSFAPAVRLVSLRAGEMVRGRFLGVFAFSYTLGVALSTLVTGALLPALGWRGAFLLTSAGPLGAALIGAIALPRDPEEARGREAFEFPPLNRPTVIAILSYTLHRWEVFGFRAWVVAFLSAALMREGLGQPEAVEKAAVAAGVLIMLSAFGNLLGGYSSDRFGRRATLAAFFSASSLLSLTAGFLFTIPYAWLVAFCAVWVLFITGDAPVFLATAAQVAPRRHLGSVMGLNTGFAFVLGAMSSPAVGWVLDLTNASAGGAYPTFWGAAFAVLGAVALLGLPCVALLGPGAEGRRAKEREAG
ncbi:MAG: MFS transporter [Nitrospinota bacterium]